MGVKKRGSLVLGPGRRGGRIESILHYNVFIGWGGGGGFQMALLAAEPKMSAVLTPHVYPWHIKLNYDDGLSHGLCHYDPGPHFCTSPSLNLSFIK